MRTMLGKSCFLHLLIVSAFPANTEIISRLEAFFEILVPDELGTV